MTKTIALLIALFAADSRAALPDVFDPQAGGPEAPLAFTASARTQTDKNPSVRYGVIINGDTEKRHQLNAEEAVVFMREQYKIQPANIYLLSTTTSTVLSSLPNVLARAAKLKAGLDENDTLVIYLTGHGGHRGSMTYLALGDRGGISDKDFAQQYLDNKAASYVFLADQCYSGGFAKKMTGDASKKVIAVSSTDDANSTVCTFFIKPYMSAFADPANDNAPKDGRVSEWEAYAKAKKSSLKSHVDQGFPRETANALYLTSGYTTSSGSVGR